MQAETATLRFSGDAFKQFASVSHFCCEPGAQTFQIITICLGDTGPLLVLSQCHISPDLFIDFFFKIQDI